jgi:SAM-dependent methyltransferase
LKDDPEFMDRVLTGRDARFQQLWFRATNHDPLQNVHGIMGARWVEAVFEGGRMLEIGGGTGNGTRHVLRLLSEKKDGPRIESYIFSDISLGFIMATRKELRELYPGIATEWRHLDINKPLGAQKLVPESLDMIFGVNAAHVASDIVGFLKECYTVLRPGGKIVFAERVRTDIREMAPRELTLNLSSYHRTAAIRTSEVRPVHGYLSPSGWLRAFELAGFTIRQLLPDLEAMVTEFPDQYAAVVHAEK